MKKAKSNSYADVLLQVDESQAKILQLEKELLAAEEAVHQAKRNLTAEMKHEDHLEDLVEDLAEAEAKDPAAEVKHAALITKMLHHDKCVWHDERLGLILQGIDKFMTFNRSKWRLFV